MNGNINWPQTECKGKYFCRISNRSPAGVRGSPWEPFKCHVTTNVENAGLCYISTSTWPERIALAGVRHQQKLLSFLNDFQISSRASQGWLPANVWPYPTQPIDSVSLRRILAGTHVRAHRTSQRRIIFFLLLLGFFAEYQSQLPGDSHLCVGSSSGLQKRGRRKLRQRTTSKWIFNPPTLHSSELSLRKAIILEQLICCAGCGHVGLLT